MPVALMWCGIDPFPRQFERNVSHHRACPSAFAGLVPGANSFFWHLSNVLEGLGVLSSLSFLMNISYKIGCPPHTPKMIGFMIHGCRAAGAGTVCMNCKPRAVGSAVSFLLGGSLQNRHLQICFAVLKRDLDAFWHFNVLLHRLTSWSTLKRWLFSLQFSNI